MKPDPLTDPTSLIAYRPANGEPKERAKRPTRAPAGPTGPAVYGVAAAGFALCLLLALTILVLQR